MTDAILRLGDRELADLAAAIQSGRLVPPYTSLAMQRVVSSSASKDIADVLTSFASRGMSPSAIVAAIELLIADRRNRLAADDVIDFVTSGPDSPMSANRDTAIVVRDLFTYAKKSVWIAGYAVHKGQEVFEALADRMAALPELQVNLLLDVRRGPGDTTVGSDLVRRFAEQFKTREWPGSRPLPKVFYFPGSLHMDQRKRAALHAKCVVVDSEMCFVSSANFTTAAQTKNIEIGLLVRSVVVASRTQRYLVALVETGMVQPMW